MLTLFSDYLDLYTTNRQTEWMSGQFRTFNSQRWVQGRNYGIWFLQFILGISVRIGSSAFFSDSPPLMQTLVNSVHVIVDEI